MSQTKKGALKAVAKYYGFTVDQYLHMISHSNYCNKCKQWKDKSMFCKDNSRATGLHKNCNECRWINNGVRGRQFQKGCTSIFKGKSHSESARAKMRIINTGQGNPNWKGGISSLLLQIRNTEAYKQWRYAVYLKDSFTCQECKTKKVGRNIVLDADHIKPLSVIVFDNNIKTVEQALLCHEIFDVENGRCLCRQCHKNTPTWGVNTNKKIRNGKN